MDLIYLLLSLVALSPELDDIDTTLISFYYMKLEPAAC